MTPLLDNPLNSIPERQQYQYVVGQYVPAQADAVVSGVYALGTDATDRATRVKFIVDMLIDKTPKKLDAAYAAQRLREIGMPPEVARAYLQRKPLTKHEAAQRLANMMQRGVAERDAVRSLLLTVMDDLVVRTLMAHGASLTFGTTLDDSLGAWETILGAVVGVIALAVSIAVPVQQAVSRRRQEREAEQRLRNAPLSPGELQQIALQLVERHQGYTRAAQTEALDIVKLMRPGRTAFVEGEERQLSQMVNDYIRQAAAARAAAAQAAQQRQLLTLGGLAALAVAGVVVVRLMS